MAPPHTCSHFLSSNSIPTPTSNGAGSHSNLKLHFKSPPPVQASSLRLLMKRRSLTESSMTMRTKRALEHNHCFCMSLRSSCLFVTILYLVCSLPLAFLVFPIVFCVIGLVGVLRYDARKVLYFLRYQFVAWIVCFVCCIVWAVFFCNGCASKYGERATIFLCASDLLVATPLFVGVPLYCMHVTKAFHTALRDGVIHDPSSASSHPDSQPHTDALDTMNTSQTLLATHANPETATLSLEQIGTSASSSSDSPVLSTQPQPQASTIQLVSKKPDSDCQSACAISFSFDGDCSSVKEKRKKQKTKERADVQREGEERDKDSSSITAGNRLAYSSLTDINEA